MISIQSRIIKKIQQIIQHYNPEKYWRRRSIVVDPENKTCVLIKLWYLYYIKKCDAYNNSSFGTNLNSGAKFKSPTLWHGLNGIIIGHDVKIGENVIICQQVTIPHGGNLQIGDNVFIGAGAKILANVGNNCRIGANCVVVDDLPDNATCVLQKPRIIIRESI